MAAGYLPYPDKTYASNPDTYQAQSPDLSWMWWRTPPAPGAKPKKPSYKFNLAEYRKYLPGMPTKNPIADVPNWQTGGRQAPFTGLGQGEMKWLYLGGAALLAYVLMTRKKK